MATPFPKTEDSEIIEIQVAVHVRKIKREQAKAGCHCPNRSGLITAPTAPRVYPKARAITITLIDSPKMVELSLRYERFNDLRHCSPSGYDYCPQ